MNRVVFFDDTLGTADDDWGDPSKCEPRKYEAWIDRGGEEIFLGAFDTPGQAEAAYMRAKAAQQ